MFISGSALDAIGKVVEAERAHFIEMCDAMAEIKVTDENYFDEEGNLPEDYGAFQDHITTLSRGVIRARAQGKADEAQKMLDDLLTLRRVKMPGALKEYFENSVRYLAWDLERRKRDGE